MSEGRFPYQKLAKYPHLKPEDVETWEAFIDKNPDAYERVDYDYALGHVPDHAAEAERLGISGVEKLNQYKVDVVGYKKDAVHIIELKGKATAAALGQIFLYRQLYSEERRPVVPTKAVIIAREATLDLPRIAEMQDVKLIVV